MKTVTVSQKHFRQGVDLVCLGLSRAHSGSCVETRFSGADQEGERRVVQARDARGLDVEDKGYGGRDRFGVRRRDSPDGLDAEVREQEGPRIT